MERYELLGLGDVIELSRRRLFQVGILLGIIPMHKPGHRGKREPGPSGLLLLMS